MDFDKESYLFLDGRENMLKSKFDSPPPYTEMDPLVCNSNTTAPTIPLRINLELAQEADMNPPDIPSRRYLHDEMETHISNSPTLPPRDYLRSSPSITAHPKLPSRERINQSSIGQPNIPSRNYPLPISHPFQKDFDDNNEIPLTDKLKE